MNVRFESGTCGLIGPNGAGKTTFFNVLVGFVRPAAGTVTAFGDNLLSMAHFRRARWGVRRTFQTEQAIESLSVYDNVGDGPRALQTLRQPRGARMSTARSRSSAWNDVAYEKVRTLGAGDRRLVELARAIVGKPRLVLLDEPAAGLPEHETAHMGQIIKHIPDRTGALTILVDHDMSLVSSCCAVTAVLDFGKLIAVRTRPTRSCATPTSCAPTSAPKRSHRMTDSAGR